MSKNKKKPDLLNVSALKYYLPKKSFKPVHRNHHIDKLKEYQELLEIKKNLYSEEADYHVSAKKGDPCLAKSFPLSTEEFVKMAKKMQGALSESQPKQFFESGVAFNTENINNTIKEYVNILKKRYEELVKQGWNPIVVGFIIENDDCLIDFTQDINGVYGSKFLFDGNRLSSKAKRDISNLRHLLKPNQNIVWEI